MNAKGDTINFHATPFTATESWICQKRWVAINQLWKPRRMGASNGEGRSAVGPFFFVQKFWYCLKWWRMVITNHELLTVCLFLTFDLSRWSGLSRLIFYIQRYFHLLGTFLWDVCLGGAKWGPGRIILQ